MRVTNANKKPAESPHMRMPVNPSIGQNCVGGVACDLMKDRSTRANPAACTATVMATRPAAVKLLASTVRRDESCG